MKHLFVSAALVILFTGCANEKPSKYAKYVDQLSTEFKESGKELAEFDQTTPGYEEEKKAARNNVAIGQKAILEMVVDNWQIDYHNEFHKGPTDMEMNEFKTAIRFTAIKDSLEQIIAESRE